MVYQFLRNQTNFILISTNFSVLINEYEETKEKLREILQDSNSMEERTIEVLKRQQEVKRNLQQFLNIELGQETIFQIAG